MGGPEGLPPMLPRRKTQSLIIAAIAALLVALPLSASGPAVAAAAAKKSSLHSKCPRQARKHRSKRRGKACRQSRGPEGGAGSQPTGAGGSAGAPTAAAAPGPPSPPETHAPPPGGSKEGPEVQPEPEPEAEPPIEPELEPEIERETEAEPEPELEVETSVKSAPKQESPLNTEPAPETSLLPFRFFSPTSFWNAEPGPTAPLDPESKALAGAFIAEAKALVEAGTGPWINTTNYSVPIVTVPASQPKVRVQLVSKYSAPALQAAWEEVPIPPTAKPASGTDGTLVVWQPATNKLWEFWRAAKTETGWQASWGGAVQNVSGAWGAYGPDAWPGAKPWWGSSASSLSIAGGLITLEDLAHGSIDHALSIAIPNVRAGVYSSPAMRTDGKSNSPLSLPEGARLRLDPSLDLTSLKLPPLTLMIARAAQRYGIFVRDRARVVHFFAEDPTSLATNPYLGKTGYFEGKTPAKLLASFPWNRLQLLRMDLHASS
jgi:hypothetical protein